MSKQITLLSTFPEEIQTRLRQEVIDEMTEEKNKQEKKDKYLNEVLDKILGPNQKNSKR